MKLWQASWPLPGAATLTLFIVVAALALIRSARRGAPTARKGARAGPGLAETADAPAKGFLDLRLVEPCSPAGASFHSNALVARTWENDVCTGSTLLLHKPTADEQFFDSGHYPYAAHMHGRKRLWEFRWQVAPKQAVSGDTFFGVQQDSYQPVRGVQRMLASNLVMALRQVCEMYQSYGDDPAVVKGENEPPTTVWSLQTTDQLVVTPPGEQPPDLCDPNFPQLGLTKANDRRAFKLAVDALEMKPGYTYTFAFWSVARFTDAVGWRSRRSGVAPGLDFKRIGIHPPCYFVMYTLGGGEGPSDNRHVPSRQIYWMKSVFWSTMVPPPPEKIAQFAPKLLGGLRGPGSAKVPSRKRRSSCLCVC